jgi:hypothetical protein
MREFKWKGLGDTLWQDESTIRVECSEPLDFYGENLKFGIKMVPTASLRKDEPADPSRAKVAEVLRCIVPQMRAWLYATGEGDASEFKRCDVCGFARSRMGHCPSCIESFMQRSLMLLHAASEMGLISAKSRPNDTINLRKNRMSKKAAKTPDANHPAIESVPSPVHPCQ